MSKHSNDERAVMTKRYAQVPDSEILDLLGPTIQYATPLSDDDDGYCLLKGTIPPGVVVPIHSHADRETFYILEGQLEALKEDSWQTYGMGNVFDVPGGTKHAFRNVSGESASALIVTTMALARFFQRVGRPVASVPPGLPSSEVLQRFAQASLAEGHWLGSVADNATVGINLLSFN
jgi:mannose-6-phosphate isomerase-like protein (cupin superfamily)